MRSNSFSLRPAAAAALVSALLCVLSPLSIPIGPVPITLATLCIYLSVYVLDWRWALCSVLVYLLLGAAGLPVFSGFSGGLGRLLGPTGGYLAGYLLLALCSGLAVHLSSRRALHLLGMLLGTAALYALGTAWYCVQSGLGLWLALGRCVWIFIPGDLLKIAVALCVGPLLRRRLSQAKLLPPTAGGEKKR